MTRARLASLLLLAALLLERWLLLPFTRTS